MNVNKSLLAVLSMFLILLLFVSSASAADANATDVLSVDESVTLENNLLSVDNNVKSNDTLKVSDDELLTAGNNWYVNGSKTSSGDGKSPESAFVSLKEAIDEASDTDTINIASGEYKGTDNTGLDIIKSLNFIKYGDGEAIFDAESQRQIWEVDGTFTNIIGLTFKNGKAENGGAIYFESDASVTNCTFIHNTANSDGGAIYFKSGDVKFDKSTFTNNTAYEDGGAIYSEVDVNIKNSTFENNKGGNDEIQCIGGAIRSIS